MAACGFTASARRLAGTTTAAAEPPYVINGLICPSRTVIVNAGDIVIDLVPFSAPNTTYLVTPGEYFISKQIDLTNADTAMGLCYIAQGPGVVVKSQVQSDGSRDNAAFSVKGNQIGLQGFVLDGSESNTKGVYNAWGFPPGRVVYALDHMVLQGFSDVAVSVEAIAHLSNCSFVNNTVTAGEAPLFCSGDTLQVDEVGGGRLHVEEGGCMPVEYPDSNGGSSTPHTRARWPHVCGVVLLVVCLQCVCDVLCTHNLPCVLFTSLTPTTRNRQCSVATAAQRAAVYG